MRLAGNNIRKLMKKSEKSSQAFIAVSEGIGL